MFRRTSWTPSLNRRCSNGGNSMGRSSPSAKSSYGHFYLFVRIKKETGRGSERPTGVRVVRDPEDVRSLGPELELEAPAGLGIDFHEETVLRRSSEGHEPFGENGRERPVGQVRARRVPGADHAVVVQCLQEGRA